MTSWNKSQIVWSHHRSSRRSQSHRTVWVNSLVVTTNPSSRKLRIRLDHMELNKANQRPYYTMRTLDDIFPQISGAKYFSKPDASSRYWTVRLSHTSSLLTILPLPQVTIWVEDRQVLWVDARSRCHCRWHFGVRQDATRKKHKIDKSAWQVQKCMH